MLVIDALNQLDETYRSHGLDWLPVTMPGAFRLCMSALEGDALEAARRKYHERQDMIVTSLRLVDQGFIIARQLQQARKRLTTARKYRQWRAVRVARGEEVPPDPDHSQLRYILTGVYSRRQTPSVEMGTGSDGREVPVPFSPEQVLQRETANPLYLKLVAEELRLFGEYDRLPEFIGHLPIDVPGMFQAVLERLEHDHGRELVEHSLSLIATGRHGLLEGEILELLARPGEARFPVALWSRLYRSLAFYFKPRASVGGGEEGLIDFFHHQLAKAVYHRYLFISERRLATHAKLAAYFCRKGDPTDDGTWSGTYPRSFSQLLRHQIHAHLWEELEQTLTTLPFLEASVLVGGIFELARSFSAAVAALREDRSRRYVLRLLHKALLRNIYFLAKRVENCPQILFQCLWNNGWWYDCPDAPRHYDPPPGGWEKTKPPWEQSGTKLYALLESWRTARENSTFGFPWLRSHRPPPMPLSQVALFQGHGHYIKCVAYSPDGTGIVSGSGNPFGSCDSTIRVWDTASGQELHCLRGHELGVNGVAYSPDGTQIVSVSTDKTVQIWDASTGSKIHCLQGHDGNVSSVAYSPDGTRIISGSRDKTVRVWDASTGEELCCLRGHKESVNSVAYSPDGTRIISGSGNSAFFVNEIQSEDDTIRIWDPAMGEELCCLRGHKFVVSSVACSPDGTRIVSGSWDGTIRVWDMSTGEEIHCLRGHELGVDSVAYSPDGTRIVSGGGNDSTVRVWDASTGEELCCLRGHKGCVSSVAYSPDGTRIISGGSKMVSVWDASTEELSGCPREHQDSVRGIAYSPDGTKIVSWASSKNNTIRVWDVAKGEEVFCLRGHEKAVASVTYSPDGRRIASGDSLGGCSGAHTVRAWDAASGAELGVLRGHEGTVGSVTYSPDGRRIASGSDDKTVRVWDAESGAELAVLCGHEGWVKSVTYSPDGRRIASGSYDETVRVWDAESGADLAVLRGHEGRVGSVTYSPDGRRIASGSEDKTVRVWDAESGAELAVLRGHEDEVLSVTYSPDGRRIASGGGYYEDQEVRVWDAQTHECLKVIQGSDDVKAIATGASEFPVRALARGQETVVERVDGRQPIAWFPIALGHIITHPSGRTWAGAAGNHLYIITLEGAEVRKRAENCAGG